MSWKPKILIMLDMIILCKKKSHVDVGETFLMSEQLFLLWMDNELKCDTILNINLFFWVVDLFYVSL